MKVFSIKLSAVSQRGVSLVELLIVISVIGFLAILVATIPNSIALVGKSNNASIAREIAVKQIEDSRAMGYESLSNGETEIADHRLNSLPDATGIVRVQDCDESICTNNEELKKVTVQINWKESGKDQEVKLTTFVSENGF